jgi:hypothetical protein
MTSSTISPIATQSLRGRPLGGIGVAIRRRYRHPVVFYVQEQDNILNGIGVHKYLSQCIDFILEIIIGFRCFKMILLKNSNFCDNVIIFGKDVCVNLFI